jgi:hypothetical protein
MAILGLEDLSPSLAQALYHFFSTGTNWQATFLADLFPQSLQVLQPAAPLVGFRDETRYDINRICFFKSG